MGYLGSSNLILMLATVFIIYFTWFNFKDKDKQKKIGVLSYILLLGVVPLSSFIIMYTIISTSFLDFYGYILVVLFTCFVFISVWVIIALNGEYKKAELSMHIVVGIVLLLFMVFMALAEVLPEYILELYLRPLIIRKGLYDILSRPIYQLAHFVTYIMSFPYIASFVVGKGILSFRRYKGLID